MLIQEPIQAAIWHCLNHYAYNDAIFLAERLYAEVNSEDSLFLLATCYYRANKRNQCYSILKNRGTVASLNSRCKFLLARCCIDMQNWAEAEEILRPKSAENLESIVTSFGDSAPFACKLLGNICSQTDRTELAKDAYVQSLKLNPFLWDSFSTICNLGENADPGKLFQVGHLESFSMCHGTQTVVSLVGSQNQEPVVMGVCNINSLELQPRYISTPLVKNNVSNVKPMSTDDVGILHPSNKNRPAKCRNLFTSTPMSANATSFGFLPLDNSSDCYNQSQNQNVGNHALTSPLNSPFMLIAPSSPIVESSEPRNKKPCLRMPPTWQPTQQTGGPLGISQITGQQQAPSSPATPQQQPLNLQTTNVRRSSRLFSNSSNVSVKENNKTPNRNRIPQSKSPSRKNKIRTPRSATVTSNNNSVNTENQKNSQYNETGGVIEDEVGDYKFITPSPVDKFPLAQTNAVSSPANQTHGNQSQRILAHQALSLQKEAAEGLMILLRELGIGYRHLCKFECKDAVESFNSVKNQQYNTGWVLGQIAKAYFELANYEEAIKYYSTMREKEPYRVEGLEWFSTALWHQQREVDLSSLAHDLMTTERKHAATWMTAGNCFSLHKEHDTAIKFFKRAIQVDPGNAYGYTLLGHEYVATEELDKAMRCFRNAARIDPRHYNAWYGIGMIFYKQERFQRAELYYKKALAIHPKNAVLLCHLGVVQHALGRTEKSLNTFDKALKENSNIPLCKFHRASVLFAVNRLDEALVELEELKQIVPKESLVYFLIAKVYSKKGETHKALLHFSWATDLDPKGANNQIKESIEPVLSRSITSLANITSATNEEGGQEIEEILDDDETDGMDVSNGSAITL